MKKIVKLLPCFFLIAAVVFNFLTLYPELFVKADPNDDIFQFSLISRMNEVWESSTGDFRSLIDHWVPNWASGFPLPFYYQHLPHLSIVFLYQLFSKAFSLYTLFNLVKFLFWVLFPFSLYFSGRKFGLSKLTSSFSAFFASQILTDGLYGADISSFAWRGYGLSTQLVALFFAPLALGQIYQVITKREGYFSAILLLCATFASHLAIGYIVFLSACLYLFLDFSLMSLFRTGKRLFLVFLFSFLLLSYWLVPLFLGSSYHNISFWDLPVKWDSYGAREVITMFLDGALFDFGRLPVLTAFLVIGFFVCLYRFEGKYRFFAFLFVFWFLLYFGRTTWGPLVNFLPMMKGMHFQRFINGVHLAGFFLIGIGANFLLEKVKPFFLSLGMIAVLAIPVYKANASYLHFNRIWLKEANQDYQDSSADFERLVARIKELPPGRVYAGRPGNWGREFKIGATQIYLALSTVGLPMNGFLPESWSLNSDPEQFFDEQRQSHYQLCNVRYLVTPSDYPVPDFAKEEARFGNYLLSRVGTSGYFDLGYSDLAVLSGKENILNIIHIWLVSKAVDQKRFPVLVLKGGSFFPTSGGGFLPQIQMVDEVNYEVLGKQGNLFANPVFGQGQSSKVKLQGEILKEEIGFQKYEAEVEVDQSCQNCLVVFKMTGHPNWEVKVDGERSEKLMVFPSFMAVEIPAGNHRVSFEYRPHFLKLPLLILSGLGFFVWAVINKKRNS